MNLTAESVVLSADKPNLASVEATVDRRADLERKQEQIAQLLQQVGCEGLLVLDPDNFAWLTSGASSIPATCLSSITARSNAGWLPPTSTRSGSLTKNWTGSASSSNSGPGRA